MAVVHSVSRTDYWIIYIDYNLDIFSFRLTLNSNDAVCSLVLGGTVDFAPLALSHLHNSDDHGTTISI